MQAKFSPIWRAALTKGCSPYSSLPASLKVLGLARQVRCFTAGPVDNDCKRDAGNFWLDIVVKERGKNLLAIECDGAGYHSSLVARTRDRARQRVLEKLGWRIHRVWSTNSWFFEPQEKEAIVVAINAARTR